jgi:hypothetical protein
MAGEFRQPGESRGADGVRRTPGRLRHAAFNLGVTAVATAQPERVFDFSGWRPTDQQLQQLKDALIVAFSRYLSYPDQDWKVIHKAEYDRNKAWGFKQILNWEYQKGSALGGYDLGRQHGAEARRQARALGHPDERPIIQSLDTNYTTAQVPGALDYMRGFNDGGGCGPQGIYGARHIIDECLNRGLIRVGWQTAATSWGPVPGVNPRAHIIQRVQKDYPQFAPTLYDQNDPNASDYGQHPFAGAPPVPASSRFMLLSDD